MIKHFFSLQFLIFALVGGLAAFVNWSSRLILSYWLPFSYAISIAYGFGMLTAFILNKLFVFPGSTRQTHKQVRDFILTNLAFFPVVWGATIQLNSWLKIINIISHTEEISHAIAISVPMIATFLIYKFVAFKIEP